MSNVPGALSGPDDVIAILRDARKMLRRYGVRRIGLFGSFARGEQTADSDLDFLVELEKPNFGDFMDLAFYLEDRFGRRVELLRDPRLTALQKLVAIDLMNRRQLEDVQNRLVGLQTCHAATDINIATDVKCPYCQFNPSQVDEKFNAGSALDELDEQLDDLLADWTKTLLANLRDPGVQPSIPLLKPAAKKLVASFLESGELPAKVSDEFVAAIQEVLAGLEKVVLKIEELKTALLTGGSPATVEELRERFDRHLDQATKRKDKSKVRIVLE